MDLVWSIGRGAWCWGDQRVRGGDLKDGAAGRGHQSSEGHRLQGQGMSELMLTGASSLHWSKVGASWVQGCQLSMSQEKKALRAHRPMSRAGIQARGHLKR